MEQLHYFDDCRHMIVGGVAAVFYGSRRATEDIDVWVHEDDLHKVTVPGLTDYLVSLARETLNDVGFAFLNFEHAGVDIIIRRGFDEAYVRHEIIEGVSVVPKDVLIEMKRETGRPVDKFDLKYLEET